MRRYIVRPRGLARSRWDSALGEDVADPGLLFVYEADGQPVPTGLFDAQGNELYALEEHDPIGFAPPA